jgi:hypothetical protein
LSGRVKIVSPKYNHLAFYQSKLISLSEYLEFLH